MTAFEIREDDLSGPQIAALLQEHLESAARHSPPGAVHALGLDALRAPDITFWSAWQSTVLVGCGALRQLDTSHGELKSMRTASSHLRRGVATMLLEHMIRVARERGYRRLSLETGKTQDFAAARALYARFGFAPCPPFGSYRDDGFSVCMTRELAPSRPGKVVNIQRCFELFDDTFSPKIIAELNGQLVLAARCEGDKVPWHRHEHEDEMFLVVEGVLEVQQRDQQVTVRAGEFYIVPRGTEHRVVAHRGLVKLLLFEPAGVKHTGDVDSEITKATFEHLEMP